MGRKRPIRQEHYMHVPEVAGVPDWTEEQVEKTIKEDERFAYEDFKNCLTEEQISKVLKDAGWPDELLIAGAGDRGNIASGEIAITNEQGHLTEQYVEAMINEADRAEDRQAVELIGEWIEGPSGPRMTPNRASTAGAPFRTERYTDGDKKVKERAGARDAPDGYIYSTSQVAEDTGVNQSRLPKERVEAMIKEIAWRADEIFKAPTEEQVEEFRQGYAAPTKEQIEELIKEHEQMRNMALVKKLAQPSAASSWAPGSRALMTSSSSTR